MTTDQSHALEKLCERYNVPFRESDYTPAFDLPDGWVNGWIGGWIGGNDHRALYVGCSPEGNIHS